MKPTSTLTATELEILQQVAQGRENRQIAIKMFRSIETVRTHMKKIYRKLGARNRAHAVAIAYHTGIFQGQITNPGPEVPSPLSPPAPRPATRHTPEPPTGADSGSPSAPINTAPSCRLIPPHWERP